VTGQSPTLAPGLEQDLRTLLDNPSDSERASYNNAVDDRVAECMIGEGFDFYPDREVAGSATSRIDFDALSEEQYAAEYGFGIATTFDANPLGALGVTDTSRNDAMLAEMSEQERHAWSDALSICRQKAADDLPPPPGAIVPTDEQAFNAVLDDIELRVQANARYADALDKWVGCMSREGFSFSSRGDMFEEVGQRAQPFLGAYFDRISNEPPETLSVITIEDIFGPDDLRDLDRVRQLEIETAVADLVCDPGLAALHDDLFRGYLTDLVDDSRS
jgi:hypothetical protein